MFRSRSWFGGGWGRPKNPHSLEHLKYLYNVLARNQTVSEHNRGLLVESLRSIAEILIWGDQNDSSVFDFFLEKNMLSFFLRIMRQRSGGSSFVCVQLLQTLNILFENIRNETSLYYLLSNNHVNSIIVHKFDFSDEEVMAYYISFLKTLSFKLNGHTIHFFYNEHTNDFPLYTEAIKFFNHRESMVRIAVRTLTLNVYKVEDASMLRFIRDRTAAPYFSNLVWFIGKHILELDSCVRNDAEHQSQQKLDDLVAEHLDHLHYLNDILCLNIPDLNQVLTEHLLHKLLIPLYIYSLTSGSSHKIKHLNKKPQSNNEQIQHIETITRNLAAILSHKGIDLSTPEHSPTKFNNVEDEQKPRVSCVVSLFLLSQVFLIITHAPLVHALAWIILHANDSVFDDGANNILENYLNTKTGIKLEFSKPSETLEKALAVNTSLHRYDSQGSETANDELQASEIPIENYVNTEHFNDQSSCDLDPDLVSNSLPSTSHVSETSSTRNNSCEDLIDAVTDCESNSKLHFMKQYSMCVNSERPENVPDSPIQDSGVESNNSDNTQDSNVNITDEEKEKIALSNVTTPIIEHKAFDIRRNLPVETKPFLETILKSLDCSENDYIALFALCLLYALINNKGINKDLLSVILDPTVKSENTVDSEGETSTSSRIVNSMPLYSETLVDKLINIVHLSCQPSSRVRLVSLELSLKLLSQAAGGINLLNNLGKTTTNSYNAIERRSRAIEDARLRSADLVRNFYKTDGIFLDMFEDEYCEMCKRPLNVEWLCMDSAILLPPTGTPMTGIAFIKRLPCGEVERARRAIRAYFLIRELSLMLNGENDTQLPLTNPLDYKQVGNVLDLNNSDLIACTIVFKDGQKSRRFMVIETIQIILVEPDQRLGWGIAKLVGNLQDLEVSGDKDDSRCLHLTIYKPPSTTGVSGRAPLLQAKFVFDDHIRCMAAKQRLTKGRTKARQKKMQQIARLLDVTGVPTAPALTRPPREHRPLFTTGVKVPGFAAALRRDNVPGIVPRNRIKDVDRSSESSPGNSGSVTPPVPGYEREAIGSYFSNTVFKGFSDSCSRVSSAHDSREQRRTSIGFRRPSPNAGALRDVQGTDYKRRDRTHSRDSKGSRDGSPKMPRPRSEEIPLEPLSTTPEKSNVISSRGQLVQAKPLNPKIFKSESEASKSSSSTPVNADCKSNLTKQTSEETSFISENTNPTNNEVKQKKKPYIETI